MAAIAGLIGYDNAAVPPSAVVSRMLDAIRSRGAVETVAHSRRYARLAQREPVAPDAPTPAAAVLDEAEPVCVVYDGELGELARLRAQLCQRGHRLPTGTAGEVLRAGYLEWGTALAERLDGHYAIAVWDSRTAECVLIRDRLGGRPLHYAPVPGGLLFASTPDALLASGVLEPAVDLAGLRELLSFGKTPGAALYRGIHEVPPGHLARIRPDGVQARCYWRLTATEHPADEGSAAGTVRELLDGAVRRGTGDGPEPVALLSGLDSYAIAALAAPGVRHRTGTPLRSLSVRFAMPGHRPAAQAANEEGAAQLARALATEHREAVVNPLRLTLPAIRSAALRARAAPALGEFDTSVYLIFQEVGRRTGLALSGDGADELFGGYYWAHDAWARAQAGAADAGTFPWTDLIDSHDRFAALLHPDLATELDLAGYRADQYAQAIAGVPGNPADSPADARMRVLDYLHLTRFLPMVLDRTDRMSAAAGVRVRMPFADHQLAGYAFNVPWSTKVRSGPKSLLRAAVHDLAPAPATGPTTDHRATPTAANLAYHGVLCAAVREVLADPGAPVRGLLHLPAVEAVLAAQPAATALNRMETELELILGLNEWLSRYQLDLVL